ncbi:MAG: type III-B CRISPR-associated protein Cas10/Cmr2 [Truepera sp.]|nr:type III-B CRISPR-associated protein Cas10/Cmr2 [Truepera sp.]
MKHLLAISIGPVQDFIAAARRTADLYAGSQILQEVCKATAKSLAENGGALIFPSGPEADGANKILAQVPGDPAHLAQTAQAAAKARLLALWQDAQAALPAGQRGLVDHGRAEAQLEGFLEFYAAWVPLANYPEDRKKADRLLAGRKALRDFAPTRQDDDGIPKSPLDPSRAAVIRPQNWLNVSVPLKNGVYRPLRIKGTEHLDAVSLLKRIYGAVHADRVVDTRTMARRAKDPHAMPDDRYGEDDDQIQEPQPYYAILVADGDRMGELISQKTTPEEHQKLSAQLDGFAQKVRSIVLKHRGFPVYTGGDDVLAILPVNTAIKCTKELSEEFRHTVRRTLSAGVAIVHYREPLSGSLEAARAAERAAKNGGRNCLAVALHTRGGAPLTVVRKWDALRWPELAKSFEKGDLTQGLAYELLELAQEWQDGMSAVHLQAEAARILGRKERKELKLPDFESREDLLTYANQLIIARFLSGIRAEDKREVGYA